MSQEVESIILRAKEDIYTLLQGGNFSKYLGHGYDFSELRAYDSGDDIRAISWINSAKLGELYVKKMHEERELNISIAMLLDGRAIIGNKIETMNYILTLISYSSLHTNNLLKISYLFGDIFKSFEPTKRFEDVEGVLKEFREKEPLELKIAYEKVEERLINSIESKSLLFIVGDFFEFIDLSILSQKHELVIIVVRDRWEENPKVIANSELVNPLNSRVLTQTLSKKSVDYYKKRLQEHDEKLFEHFNHCGVKYIKVYDFNEVIDKLETLFEY